MPNDAHLLHELPLLAASRTPERTALIAGASRLTYAELEALIGSFVGAMMDLGIGRGERVAIWLDKRVETVASSFGAAATGAVFVPINPLLKPTQVAYILSDCGVRTLVTTPERLESLHGALDSCHDLRHTIVVGGTAPVAAPRPNVEVHDWNGLLQSAGSTRGHRVIDNDVAAILYTSGSTGRPKGVVLSHRNMVVGAKSVAEYLENGPQDVLLAALPLSFDAGFSQLTTAFHSGASVVLLNYLLPKDVVKAAAAHGVTGLTAVPPLWIQLTQVAWPKEASQSLRYFANTGGRMPKETLSKLRALLPTSKPFLMYGLTEAFRATYLPPSEVDARPDSIGRAIPNSEILVLREDGSPCSPHEPGELVQRGALVAQGYWNDPEKTAERFRPLPGQEQGLVLPEIAVFSGDTVKCDEEGFLYFIGRRDEMIKSSGYRISPSEVEEVLYGSGLIGECAVFGVPSANLGEVVAAVVTAAVAGTAPDIGRLIEICRERLPAYMVPTHVVEREGPLPRNANGKIDRKLIGTEFRDSTS